MNINVYIKQEKARRLAVIEHRGDSQKLIETVNSLQNWAKVQTSDQRPRAGKLLKQHWKRSVGCC